MPSDNPAEAGSSVRGVTVLESEVHPVDAPSPAAGGRRVEAHPRRPASASFGKALIAVAVVFVAMTVAVQSGGQADAESTGGDVWYCYSHDITYFYESGQECPDDVTWEVSGLVDGDVVPIGFRSIVSGNLWMVSVDREAMDGCDEVYITKMVRDGEGTSTTTDVFVPVADLVDGEYIHVMFYDGFSGALVDAGGISGDSIVMEGEDFVSVPDAPVRDGFTFAGWFTEDGAEFDPTEPVTGDLRVHAVWAESSGSGDVGDYEGTTVVVGGSTVTFVMPAGVSYGIVSLGGDRLAFSLEVAEGFVYDVSTVEVSSSNGDLTVSDGLYTIEGIDGDTVVTVTAERMFGIDVITENVTVDAATAMPGLTQGPFHVRLVADDGYELSSAVITMGGVDVTDEFLDGDTITIDRLSGDLRIYAEAVQAEDGGFHWYCIAALAVVAVLALAVIFRRRTDSARER